jgi:hypothetical protein
VREAHRVTCQSTLAEQSITFSLTPWRHWRANPLPLAMANMHVPDLLIPLLGLLTLLGVVVGVELAVIGAFTAMQTCGILPKDFMAKTLVHDATLFNCGLLDLFRAKSRALSTADRRSNAEEPHLSVGRKVRVVRVGTAILTAILVVSGEYVVFFTTQKTRTVQRISDGVSVISFEGRDAIEDSDIRRACVIDDKSARGNSMVQYVYESCIENTFLDGSAILPVNRDVRYNFSTNGDGFLSYDLESQGRPMLTMVPLDFVTTFDDPRALVSYSKELTYYIELHQKASGCFAAIFYHALTRQKSRL